MFDTTDIESLRIIEKIKLLLERSDDPHDIYTALPLCQEVIDKIPSLNGNILVISNIEFLYTMMKYGVDRTRLFFATPCDLKAAVAETVITKSNIIRYNNVIKNKDVNNMKFDVVIGNPPYQEGARIDNANKLWPQFVRVGFSLLKPNGTLAMITPNSWLTPAADIGKGKSGFSIYRDILQPFQLIYANIDSNSIKSKYFPTIGSTFSWYIIKNTKCNNTTSEIDSINGNMYIDVQDYAFLPVILSTESFSIIKKFTQPTHHFSMCDQSHEVMSDKINGANPSSTTKTPTFRFPNYHTPAKGGQYRFSSIAHSKHNSKKIMISLSGKYIAKPDMGTMGYTGMCLVLLTEYPNNAADVFNSKLFQFMIYNTKYFGFNPRHMILKLPSVDLTRSWTDEELYDHFNLTTEEIKLIEDTIK